MERTYKSILLATFILPFYSLTSHVHQFYVIGDDGSYCINTVIHKRHANVTEKPRALIFGIGGQDGYYLSTFLLRKGYDICGVLRVNEHYINNELNTEERSRLVLVEGDLTDRGFVVALIGDEKPDEIYHLAAQSSVALSFKIPYETSAINAMGSLAIFDAVRSQNLIGKTRIFHAASSELFGKTLESPQNEMTPFNPQSPYAVTKLFAVHMSRIFREMFNMYISNAFLYNHESPRRPDNFVSRKISRHVAAYKAGKKDILSVGNIHALRDWGFAGDYIEAMWLTLQQDKADDYVIASGKTFTVKEFIQESFAHIGIDLSWSGEGVNEVGSNKETGETLVIIDPQHFRPTEPFQPCGDNTKARLNLKWTATTTFKELVHLMVDYDIAEYENHS